MTRQLDMRELASAVDRRDFNFLDRQTEAAKKEFVYSVAMRWLHEIRGNTQFADDYIVRFNERVNQYGDLIWAHPDLAFRLMASCGTGRVQAHEYRAPPKSATKTDVIRDFLSLEWQGINDDEAEILLSQMDKKTFDLLLKESTLDPDEQKKVSAAYAKRKKV